jgi:microcystin-dependent protein
MSEPFLGEVKLFSFNFAPRGWAQCNGQLLPISQNQALFSLLGTMYGGNGVTTFALPELQGRISMHVSNNHTQGQKAGEETHTLTVAELAAHNHPANCSTAAVATQASPAGRFWAHESQGNAVFSTTGGAVMAPGAIGNAGGGQAHANLAPFLVVNFCIALQGIFPSRS